MTDQNFQGFKRQQSTQVKESAQVEYSVHNLNLGIWKFSKGQIISKCLFGAFNFLQKMNENKSTWGFIVVK